MRRGVNERNLAAGICPLALLFWGCVCVCVRACICMRPTLRSFVAIVMLLHIYFWSTELSFSIAPENIGSRIKVSLQGQCVNAGMFAILFAFSQRL